MESGDVTVKMRSGETVALTRAQVQGILDRLVAADDSTLTGSISLKAQLRETRGRYNTAPLELTRPEETVLLWALGPSVHESTSSEAGL